MTDDQTLAAAMALIESVRVKLTPTHVTDRLVRKLPPLPKWGPAGTSIVDPTFGCRISRITDARINGGSWRVASNTHLSAWNTTSSAFFVMGGGGEVAVYSWTDHGVLIAAPYSQAEPCFSRDTADILYTVGGPNNRTIRAYHLSTDTFTDIVTLDAIVGGLQSPVTYTGGIIATPGNVLVTFFGGTGQDAHHYVMKWTPTGYVLWDTVSMNVTVHSASCDFSGRYVMVYPAGGSVNGPIPQVIVWDTQLDTKTPVWIAPGGHDSLGYGVWINADIASGLYDAAQWVTRPLTDLTHPVNLIDPVLRPAKVYWAEHSSWNGVGPFFSGTYRTAADETPWRAWDNEILRVASDGSSVVARLAHHRSDMTEGFWSQPIINADPSGRRILFTSNWERSLGVDGSGAVRQDVFCLEVA